MATSPSSAWLTCSMSASRPASPTWPFPSKSPTPRTRMHVANAILIGTWWDAQLARWAVWGGLVLLTVALLLLIRTRWGQQPLGKCVVLSLLAHLLLAI